MKNKLILTLCMIASLAFGMDNVYNFAPEIKEAAQQISDRALINSLLEMYCDDAKTKAYLIWITSEIDPANVNVLPVITKSIQSKISELELDIHQMIKLFKVCDRLSMHVHANIILKNIFSALNEPKDSELQKKLKKAFSNEQLSFVDQQIGILSTEQYKPRNYLPLIWKLFWKYSLIKTTTDHSEIAGLLEEFGISSKYFCRALKDRVILYDSNSNQMLVHELTNDKKTPIADDIHNCSFLGDGEKIIIVDPEIAFVVDSETGKTLKKFIGQVTLNERRDTIFLLKGFKLLMYDVFSLNLINTIDNCNSISADSSVALKEDNCFCILQTFDSREISRSSYPLNQNHCYFAAFNDENTIVATTVQGSKNNFIYRKSLPVDNVQKIELWDVKTGALLADLTLGLEIKHLFFHGNNLIVIGKNSDAKIYSLSVINAIDILQSIIE